jgi:hypothetical protein
MIESVSPDSDWRTATFSFANGNCVEVGADYRKSSRSIANGDCAEVASGPSGILVRDTVDRDGAVLTFSPEAWAAFTRAVRS